MNMRCFALLSAWVFSSKCAAYFQNTCFARTPMERCFCLSVLTKNEVVRHVVPCSTYSVLVLVPFHSCLNYGNRLSSAAIVTRVSKIQKPSVFIGQLSDAVKNHKDSYRSTVLLSLRPPFEAWLQKRHTGSTAFLISVIQNFFASFKFFTSFTIETAAF